MTTRQEYRHKVGRSLGREYWDVSTVGSGSTTTEIVDARRTEFPAFWDGASLYVDGLAEVPLRGGGGAIRSASGKLYTDRALSGTPSAATQYEVLKGWTFADMDDALDWAFANAYDEFFTPINDSSTVSETENVLSVTLTATWKSVTAVRRERTKDASPAFYDPMIEGKDYRIGHAATGALTLEWLKAPVTGYNIQIVGKGLPTLASGDTGAGTPDIPWQVIVPGAKHYLFDKGISADLLGSKVAKKFQDAALQELALFEKRKTEYRMRPLTVRRVSFPVITELNDGNTVQH